MELGPFLLSLIIIYASARLFSELAVRLGLSAVLGELLAGVLVGGSVLGWVEPTETLTRMGQLGVMLLLFEIGLESDLKAFLRVGGSAAIVAVLGVLLQFALGFAVAHALGYPQFQAIFLGAALTATSVAISVRTLFDLGKIKSREGNVILGAAVLDDILGLVILSVIVSVAANGTVSWLEISRTVALAVLFVSVAIFVGVRYTHRFSQLVNRMHTRGSLVIASLIFALVLGYVAHVLQLAALIGTFAAGLVLARTEHRTHIGRLIKPVADVFVPIFFVLIGVAVEVGRLNPLDEQNWPTLILAGGLTVAAITGKLLSGFGVPGTRYNRWAIGAGMLPRGEVDLIFARVGLTYAIISTAEYGAILIVVALTTIITPLLLKFVFRPIPSRPQKGAAPLVTSF